MAFPGFLASKKPGKAKKRKDFLAFLESLGCQSTGKAWGAKSSLLAFMESLEFDHPIKSKKRQESQDY